MTAIIILPDLLSQWPAIHALNSHYEEAGSESARWVESFHVLDPNAQVIFNTHDFALVASRFYPYANREQLRLACDLMNWFFAYDAVSDEERGASVQEIAATLIDILRDPSSAPSTSSPLSEMTQCLWSRIVAFATPVASQRLGESLRRYIGAVGVEAEDRESGIVRPIEDYLTLRRDTAAVKCCADFLLLQHDITEEVMTHPCIEKLTVQCMDVQIFINDVLSYNFERRHGQDGHNVVTAVMREKSFDVQAALDYTADWCHQTMRSLLEDFKAAPSFSPSIDNVVQEYMIGLNTLITGLYDWSFESERYFGAEGLDVKRTRVVQLYQPVLEQKSEAPHDDSDGGCNVVATLQALQEVAAC